MRLNPPKQKFQGQLDQATVSTTTATAVALEGAHFAKEVGLRYVRDMDPGIIRKRAGKGFCYYYRGERVSSDKTLHRIRSLVIPPAWDGVWICQFENGHLQATGRDARDRKQYRYHPEWSKARNENKFEKLLQFGHCLPLIRERVRQDLKQKEFTKTKVLAAVVQIMENTRIRIGNDIYAEENDSYGLTTIHNDHVKVRENLIKFQFRGKSGVLHESTLNDSRLGKIIKHCQDLPGEELFAYRDENGIVHDIGSGDVNEYLRQIAGEPITAKDFRTWGGTLKAAEILLRLGPPEDASETKYKKRMVHIMRESAQHLRNTVAVCRKYYIHPGLFELDKDGSLHKAFAKIRRNPPKHILSVEEILLMEILKKTPCLKRVTS